MRLEWFPETFPTVLLILASSCSSLAAPASSEHQQAVAFATELAKQYRTLMQLMQREEPIYRQIDQLSDFVAGRTSPYDCHTDRGECLLAELKKARLYDKLLVVINDYKHVAEVLGKVDLRTADFQMGRQVLVQEINDRVDYLLLTMGGTVKAEETLNKSTADPRSAIGHASQYVLWRSLKVGNFSSFNRVIAFLRLKYNILEQELPK